MAAREFLRQTRLSDTRLAGDEQQLRTAILCAAPHLPHLPDLGVASDDLLEDLDFRRHGGLRQAKRLGDAVDVERPALAQRPQDIQPHGRGDAAHRFDILLRNDGQEGATG